MRVCAWCREELPASATERRRFCTQLCRQSAFRVHRSSGTIRQTSKPLVFAYADPPYPGFARKLYRRREVDHASLIVSLENSGYAGWALSTSAKSLRQILPLCPERARVCAWVKPIAANPRTRGLHNTWEPLIVCPGRYRRPGVKDWLSAQPARRGGTLPGRKPLAFCSWLFKVLGMMAGDELVELFPGTAIVSRAWAELSSSGHQRTERVSVADSVTTERSVARESATEKIGAERDRS